MNIDKALNNILKAQRLLPDSSVELVTLKKIFSFGNDLSAQDLIEASNILNLGLEKLVSKDLSSEELSNALFTNENSFENYEVHEESFARKKTLHTLTNYLDKVFGDDFVDSIHKNLGISRCDLRVNSHNEKVSPLLIMDFFMGLSNTDIHENVFRYLANDLSSKSVPSEERARYQGLKAIESMELFTSETLKENFDNLFNYTFQHGSSKGLVVKVEPIMSNHELYSTGLIGNKALCRYKIGVFESFLNIAGLEKVSFYHEPHCLYDGAKSCEYHFKISKHSPALSQYH